MEDGGERIWEVYVDFPAPASYMALSMSGNFPFPGSHGAEFSLDSAETISL
jgi:hypothetical protein